MIISEAIEFAMEQQEIFSGEMGKFLSQVTDWLEELEECKAEAQRAYNRGYNKAIDDFAKTIREKSSECYVDCNPAYWNSQKELIFKTDLFLEEIAEQLKEK